MAETYTRQSSFTNGDVIDAPLFNSEFDQLEAAFHEDTGHNHDGTPGAGAPVPLIEKENSGIYIDTTIPLAHKITVKINGVVVTDFTAGTLADTSQINHTPTSTGVPEVLLDYLDGLEIAVGDAATDAASAAASAQESEEAANRAEAAAMTLGVPLVIPDGATYDILATTVQVDLVCLGNATVNLPATLTAGYRYSIRVSSTATTDKRCVIMNPSFNIIGDVRTLVGGQNLELKRREIAILDVLDSNNLEII